MKRWNRYRLLVGMSVLFIPLLAGCAEGPIREKIFLTKVLSNSQAEIKYSQLAEKNSNSLKVKAFATRLIVEHKKFCEKAEEVSRRLNITVSPELDRDQSAAIDSLSKLGGVEFDRYYLNLLIEDHERGLKALQDELEKGNSEEVKELCSDALPHMQRDLRRAQTLAEQSRRK
jgi:putative membrane protein